MIGKPLRILESMSIPNVPIEHMHPPPDLSTFTPCSLRTPSLIPNNLTTLLDGLYQLPHHSQPNIFEQCDFRGGLSAFWCKEGDDSIREGTLAEFRCVQDCKAVRKGSDVERRERVGFEFANDRKEGRWRYES